MNRYLIWTLVLTLAGPLRGSDWTEWEFEIDFARTAVVENLELRRDAALFKFDQGKLFLTKSIRNRTCAAIFCGRGSFEAIPPTVVELAQVQRAVGEEVVFKTFDRVLLLFTDTTMIELQRSLLFTQAEDASDPSEFLERGIESGFGFDSWFSLLNAQVAPLFYAHMAERPQGLFSGKPRVRSSNIPEDVFFRITPIQSENVQIMRKVSAVWTTQATDLVSQFHTSDHYQYPLYLRDLNSDYYAITAYKMDVSFNDKLGIAARCELDIEPLRGGISVVGLALDPELLVDSILVGERMAAFKSSAGIHWIEMDSTFANGQKTSLDMYYHGQTMERVDDYVFVRNQWYPVAPNEGLRKAYFDLLFHLPSQYQMVCVGDLIKKEVTKGVVHYQWQTSEPIYSASINVGFLDEYQIKDERIPPLVIMKSQVGYKAGKDMDKQVGADIANSLAFFQDILGPCRAKQLYISEIPYLHGVAYAGLINLSWYTFHSTGESGFDESFRSHEVAHQWWGVDVQTATYHDRWLSEGFAEYFGLWYTQSILQDNDKFFEFLIKYRKRMLNNRTSVFERLVGDDQEAGPIWMGRRTASAKTPGDYGLIVYEKGAWVLHMLRTMMLDLTTMKEDRFRTMMREFYQTYAGKAASTRDFQRIVEKHVGIDMNWFFEQWVYGTDIPKYSFSCLVRSTADGKYKVRCRVVQEHTQPDFQMFVPIHVDFGQNRYVALRALVKGPLSEFDLPLLPFKPLKITFNPLESVLCEVEETKWK